MIKYVETPNSDNEIFKTLNPIVGNWFKRKFGSFSYPQRYAVLNIHKGKNTLVSAVTGSGKTLTAFSSILSELITLSENNLLEDKTYAIYVSPLKALNNDVFFNLEKPLKEMEELAGKSFGIRIAVRTGDTSVNEKNKMLRKAPNILITTPESLAIVLTTTKFREYLRDVKYVIIDELHALADNKRGVHLSLSLERLQDLTKKDFTRIGLGATCEPIEEIAQFLVGSERDCDIAKIDLTKKMDIKVLSPVDDLINTSFNEQNQAMYELIDNLIQSHKTTLIFTNTRAATERVVHHLKEKFPSKYSENIGAHHGSLGKELRLKLEERMRNGELKVCVTSTSLELGVDIGYIDLVILLGSPKSIARCIQRNGRSGHALHDTIKGRIIVLDRDDLVECSLMLKSAIERKIDNIHIPKNCLDVLSQQIYGIAIADRISYNDLFSLIKNSYCYSNLSKKDFDSVLSYLNGDFSKLEDRHVYAKIWWDKENNEIGRKGKLARIIYMTNIGTIPDETFIKVKVGEQVVGTIDEGFLERLKRGDVFVLGGERYEFLFSRGMTAQVNASVYRPPTIPSWFSEMLPLSFDLGLEIGRFRRLMEEKFKAKKKKEEIFKFIDEYLYIDKKSRDAIYNYFKEMYYYIKELPTDKKIIIEHYKEENKNYYIFHSLYGRRVNDVLSRSIGYGLKRLQFRDMEIGVNDNGFYLASTEKLKIMNAIERIHSNELEKVMENAIERTEVLSRRFRHCATRGLMILREYKGKRKRVGRQQVSSMLLLSAVKRIDNDFSILKEARREVLEDLMDIENAKKVIKGIEDKKIAIKEIITNIPSPFAFNIVLEARTDVFKIEDKIEFLRRMHQMVLAKIGQKEII